MTFYGYKRPDGRVGVRNHVLILPASVCASDTTRIIASQVEGAVSFNNQQGCSQVGPDMQMLEWRWVCRELLELQKGCEGPFGSSRG